jgi:hypothetical protein
MLVSRSQKWQFWTRSKEQCAALLTHKVNSSKNDFCYLNHIWFDCTTKKLVEFTSESCERQNKKCCVKDLSETVCTAHKFAIILLKYYIDGC